MLETQENKLIQANSPDGGFLASGVWREFQEAAGKNVFHIGEDGFSASIIEHGLPLVGKYLYVPRGPVVEIRNSFASRRIEVRKSIGELISLAKKNKAGWIRIEPATGEVLDFLKKNAGFPVRKAPHDMQPKEVFIVNISESEEELLSSMKPKTRYNIRLAEKKGAEALVVDNRSADAGMFLDEFIRLVGITAKRDGIVSHPDGYYRKMFATVPPENLRLYVARYDGKIIAANLVAFFGDTATYLHGASDNENRNLMAPYLLQWRQMMDAKAAGCAKYDFGGVFMARESGMASQTADKKVNMNLSSWAGITKFKVGFSPKTDATFFPGSYDIIVDRKRYFAYKSLSVLMPVLKHIRRCLG